MRTTQLIENGERVNTHECVRQGDSVTIHLHDGTVWFDTYEYRVANHLVCHNRRYKAERIKHLWLGTDDWQ